MIFSNRGKCFFFFKFCPTAPVTPKHLLGFYLTNTFFFLFVCVGHISTDAGQEGQTDGPSRHFTACLFQFMIRTWWFNSVHWEWKTPLLCWNAMEPVSIYYSFYPFIEQEIYKTYLCQYNLAYLSFWSQEFSWRFWLPLSVSHVHHWIR